MLTGMTAQLPASAATASSRTGAGDSGAAQRPGNRERILAAARHEFALHGFKGATLRRIAGGAGVDVALIAHYFGNKQGLFAEAMQLPDQAHRVVTAALEAPVGRRGEVLARGYLSLWEDPTTSEAMRAVAHASLTDEAARQSMRAVIAGKAGVVRLQELPEVRRDGITLAMTQLLGLAIARYIVQADPVADIPFEELVRRAGAAAELQLSLPEA